MKDDKWFFVAFPLLFWNLHEKLHTSQLSKLVVLQGRLDRSRFGATPWGFCFSFFFSSNIKILWKKYSTVHILQSSLVSVISRRWKGFSVGRSLSPIHLPPFSPSYYPQRISFRHQPRRLCRTWKYYNPALLVKYLVWNLGRANIYNLETVRGTYGQRRSPQ